MRENTVVLPAPEGPTKAVMPRGGMVRLRPAVGFGELGAVAEVDLVEGDRGGCGPGWEELGGAAVGLHRELLGVANAGDRGRADLVLAGRADQPLHGREQVVQVEQEGDEGADVYRARGDPGATQ